VKIALEIHKKHFYLFALLTGIIGSLSLSIAFSDYMNEPEEALYLGHSPDEVVLLLGEDEITLHNAFLEEKFDIERSDMFTPEDMPTIFWSNYCGHPDVGHNVWKTFDVSEHIPDHASAILALGICAENYMFVRTSEDYPEVRVCATGNNNVKPGLTLIPLSTAQTFQSRNWGTDCSSRGAHMFLVGWVS